MKKKNVFAMGYNILGKTLYNVETYYRTLKILEIECDIYYVQSEKLKKFSRKQFGKCDLRPFRSQPTIYENTQRLGSGGCTDEF